MIVSIHFFQDERFDSFVHSMHGFRFLEFYSHLFNIFIKEVESSFTVGVKGDVNIFKSITACFISRVEVNIGIIVFNKSIGPWFKKSFFPYQTLFINWNLFIKKSLDYWCEYNFKSFQTYVFKIFSFKLILHGQVLYLLSMLSVDYLGDEIQFPTYLFRKVLLIFFE